MDAPEEDKDVLLQRSSEDILSELQTSLKSFLRKTEKKKVRRHVRVRETQGILSLVCPTSTTTLHLLTWRISSNISRSSLNSSTRISKISFLSYPMPFSNTLPGNKAPSLNALPKSPPIPITFYSPSRRQYANFYTHSARFEGAR